MGEVRAGDTGEPGSVWQGQGEGSSACPTACSQLDVHAGTQLMSPRVNHASLVHQNGITYVHAQGNIAVYH